MSDQADQGNGQSGEPPVPEQWPGTQGNAAMADPPPGSNLPDPGEVGPNIVHTANEGLTDGVNRCPKCGSTNVELRQTGMLRCLFCRNEWSEAKIEDVVRGEEDLTKLEGTTIASGAQAIDPNAAAVITLKCQGCGSEVVIDSRVEVAQRCHWCRQVLTLGTQIENGAVPDAVLPFSITHEQAVQAIKDFAGRRRTFALPRFKREFTPENVLGVYLPYMVVDGNASAGMLGYGEVTTRTYTRGSGNDRKTYYDADVYQVRRNVQYTADDLTIESSSSRANMNTLVNTNNIINTILPFDTKNAVQWNANYLTGFTSEKRDLDVEGMRPVFEDQMLSIARSLVMPSVSGYDRGVRWEGEMVNVHGSRWMSMYLPVWLYSYYEQRGNGQGLVHYIAVNGRTGETMGSIPISRWRMVGTAFAVGTVIEILAIAATIGMVMV